MTENSRLLFEKSCVRKVLWLNSWCCHWAVRPKIKHPPLLRTESVPAPGCAVIKAPSPRSILWDLPGLGICPWCREICEALYWNQPENPFGQFLPLHCALEQICDFLCLNVFVYSVSYLLGTHTIPTPYLCLFSVFSCWWLADKLFPWYPNTTHTGRISLPCNTV